MNILLLIIKGLLDYFQDLSVMFKNTHLYRLTRECVALQNHTQIQKLLKLIGGDFVSSHNPNTRKGALVGLAAIAIALGKVTLICFNKNL